MKILAPVGIGALVVWVILCAVMYFAQDELLYHPTPEVARPGFQALRLKNGAATIKVWESHPEAGAALIYFGGNGEDVGSNLENFAVEFPERALYLVNYRGYGGSTGHPREADLISDAEMVYDWVAAHHDRIVVMGRSLGTGVATALASRRSVVGLVLVTPYDSIANVASDRYPWVPVRLLLKDPYDSLARIGQVRVPVLVLIAQNDRSIARVRSNALVAAIPAGMGHTVVLPQARHSDIATFPSYWPSVKAFLVSLTLPAPSTATPSS